MSIEKLITDHTAALAANTAAVTELTSMWGKLYAAASVATTFAVDVDTPKGTSTTVVTKVEKPKAEKTAAAPTPPVVETPPAKKETATAPLSDSTADHDGSPFEATLEDVQGAIQTWAKSHRDEVVAILKKFGAKRGSEIKPEKYNDFLTEVNALGELA